MNSTEITKRFIVGQRNLDRMKDEIYQVSNGMIGLLKHERDYKELGKKWEFESTKCLWCLEVIKSNLGSAGQYSLVCWVKNAGGGSCTAFSINWNRVELSLDQIQTVHEDLPTFVQGLRTAFPVLCDVMKSHIRASSKKF